MKLLDLSPLTLELAPLPEPRRKVKNLMMVTAGLIGAPGGAERRPSRSRMLQLPQAALAVLGTACQRPLLQLEAEQRGTMLGANLLIVRCDPDWVSFDVGLLQQASWMNGYLLWISAKGDPWLIPPGKGHAFIRLTAVGLKLGSYAPFESSIERQDGLQKGTDLLVSGMKGAL